MPWRVLGGTRHARLHRDQVAQGKFLSNSDCPESGAELHVAVGRVHIAGEEVKVGLALGVPREWRRRDVGMKMTRACKVVSEADDAPEDVLGEPGSAGVPAEDAKGEVGVRARQSRNEPDGPEDGRCHVHQVRHHAPTGKAPWARPPGSGGPPPGGAIPPSRGSRRAAQAGEHPAEGSPPRRRWPWWAR